MPYCEKCGSEVGEDDTSCPSCGAPVKSVSTRRVRRVSRGRREDELCFGAEPRRDPLGLVGFGLFLLVVGLVFQMNTGVHTEFLTWVESMADSEALVMPPETLLNSAVLFFGLIGLSNFLTAVIRFLIDKDRGRITTDVLSGVGILAFAYLINLWSSGAVTWTMVLAYEAILVGALIILGSVLRQMF